MQSLFAWADRRSWLLLGGILALVAIIGFLSCGVHVSSINCAAFAIGGVTGSAFRIFGMALIVLAIARRMGINVSFADVLAAVIPAVLVMEIALLSSFFTVHILMKVILLTGAAALLVIGMERLFKLGIRQAIGTAVLVIGITSLFWFTVSPVRLGGSFVGW